MPQPRVGGRSSISVLQNQEQLVQSQAPSAKSRTPVYDHLGLLGLVGSSVSSRRVPITTLHEMSTDAVLMFASLIAMVPIFTAKWRIRCADPQLAQFIDQALRRIYGRLVTSFFLAGNYGFQALVKEFGLLAIDWEYLDKDAEGGPKLEPVWDHDFKALVWEPPVTLRPETVEPSWSSDGSFNGIQFSTANGFTLDGFSFPVLPVIGADGKDDPSKKRVDLEHSLWIVSQRDAAFGSIWGYPKYGYALKYWRLYELTLNILGRSIERKGDPIVVVRYPEATTLVNGVEVPNKTIAQQIGRSARSGSILLIPSEGHEETDGGAKNPKWAVEYLKTEESFDKLQAVLGYLDTMKFKAMTTSELSVAEGSGGSSSRNVAAETAIRGAEAQVALQAEHDSIINRYMIPQLVEQNFPEKRDVPIAKETQTFGDDETALHRTLLESFANANSDKLPIDWRPMLERFKVDTLSGPALERFEQRMIQESTTATPEATPTPPAGGDAGVTDTGFYYGARDLIELGDDDAHLLHTTLVDSDTTFLAELPKTRHFSDSAVLGQTRLIKTLWEALLKEQYEDFARYLDSDPDLGEVSLTEEDDEKRARQMADRLLKGWRFSTTRTKRVVKRTGEALKAIFARAGEVELKKSGANLDDWNPDETELARWVAENAAKMVKLVDETTKDQLRSFLVEQVKANANAKQIAAAARERFAEYNNWRATRLVRTEVRRFYNASTAFAAMSVDAQVQMLDGRHGNSDEECLDRDGRIVSPEEFMKQNALEHPNGTLAGRIVSPGKKIKIERVNAEEEIEYGAWFDRATDTIYLAAGLTRQQEAHYLRQVGDWLENVR